MAMLGFFAYETFPVLSITDAIRIRARREALEIGTYHVPSSKGRPVPLQMARLL